MTEPLSWKNDPLLLEDQPNHTINLNDLLEENGVHDNLLATPLVNFYSILIKKREFIQNNTLLTRTRILPRMPYLSFNNYPYLKDELAEQNWLLAEKARDYFYRSAMQDNSIKNWKQRINRYTEGEAIPLPILRGSKEIWQQLTEQILKEQQIIIQSAKGERSIIPLEITEKLVYLLGIIDGDGHLSKHQVHIVDYSKKQIEQLQKFCKELFGVTGNIVEGKEGNYYIFLINGKWIVRLVNFITGHSLGRKYDSLREPLILREQPWEHLRGAYWRGMFDADGSYKKTLMFGTISTKIINDLEAYFSSLGINYRIKQTTMKGYTLYVYADTRQKVFDAIGCWHPEKLAEFQQLVTRNWYGSLSLFHGLQFENMIDSDYFNFCKLPGRIRLINGGKVIKKLREQMCWTQNELADELAVSLSSISKYEQLTINPRMDLITKLFTICGVLSALERMRYFERNSLQHFTFQKKVARLPYQTSTEVYEVMAFVHPRANNIVVSLSNKKEIDQLIMTHFNVTFLEDTRYLKNLTLHSFLKTFGHYSSRR
ncbi:MAG: LAGLIDADG family homing endonuclease [Candidatus Heimdallarchaeota archaeon]